MGNLLVYALTHPSTGEIRYVGKSERGMRRPREHANNKRLQHLPLYRWINKLRSQGLDYVIQVIEEYQDRPSLLAGERFHIARIRVENPGRLLNICDGGEGFTGPHSKESKRKMKEFHGDPERRRAVSKRLKELWQKAAYVQKVRDGHERNKNNPSRHLFWLGRKHSAETIAKMKGKKIPRTAAQLDSIKKVSQGNVGRKHPPRPLEWCLKLGHWKGKVGPRKGWVPTTEERIRLAEQSQKMWNDPKQRQKMVLIRRAQMTPEVKKKVSDSLRKRFADPANREKSVLAANPRPIVDQNGTKYLSAGTAARILGLHRSQVNKVLKGKRKNTGGYVFRYLDS